MMDVVSYRILGRFRRLDCLCSVIGAEDAVTTPGPL